MNDKHYDVIIIGAGAAGLFCAFNAAANGKRVLVLDHANKVGKKILMSGGGRCNFTNLNTTAEDFYSQNPHFCKSALNQYSAYGFLSLVEQHNIEYVEKAPGQLFCKNSSRDILDMLLDECAKKSIKIYKKCTIASIEKNEFYNISTSVNNYSCDYLVIATGGLSIPTLGASGFGYEVAQKFGHEIVETKASLVPFTLSKKELEKLKSLSGISLRVTVKHSSSKKKLREISDDLLFTHRGLSGPAILKISAYWSKGEKIEIDLSPGQDIEDYLQHQKNTHPEQLVLTALSHILPKKLATYICADHLNETRLKQLNKQDIEKLCLNIHEWKIYPDGTEGYKTAEVTTGGVDTAHISSKNCESKLSKNLFFIGEVLDVTGQLGGYNFQWAWSSAWCAAEYIRNVN